MRLRLGLSPWAAMLSLRAARDARYAPPPPQRLEDIHSLEQSMADKAGWARLAPTEQQDKMRFYQVGG